MKIPSLTGGLLIGALTLPSWAQEEVDEKTGLVIDEGFEIVKANCTGCHSARLITQNRATREGWKETIRWMQRTQNLWQFDPQTEEAILDYLAKHYAPEARGRRPNLKIEKWYFLEGEEPPQ
ncbi:hypothetical protein [Nitrosococcus wardiae]|uniref:Quinohemoprotein amine dehydrogenase alpha subunit haem binding domain-containing protein n=1 Tax=Nitrosococcus wardiae TaxID=1814290 RepID=A0A4P7BZ97_9GAMM|nr:hypothetical protein [Nitrosococcus wardiae]QBQ55538.1 hypothetical protein E3U44_14235 [Nitrosococcus wardiae]